MSFPRELQFKKFEQLYGEAVDCILNNQSDYNKSIGIIGLNSEGANTGYSNFILECACGYLMNKTGFEVKVFFF